MDFYARRRFWNRILLLAGLIIIVLTLFYTRYLANKLIQQESQTAELFGFALTSIIGDPADTSNFFICDLTAQNQFIAENKTIPVILIDDRGQILGYKNIGAPDEADTTGLLPIDTAFGRQFLRAAVGRNETDSIKIETQNFKNYVIFTKSATLRLLGWYPLFQLALILAFVGLGYFVFSNARRSEQNRVWVGMAKETAHQLGTPISGIIGWVENLKLMHENEPTTLEMLSELEKDIDRLNLVSERFSKIGASPDLSSQNLYEVVRINADYMRRRAPRKVALNFAENDGVLMVKLNAQLFDWVLENLFRNAIDALENGQGIITATIYREGNFACLDLSDTGKGIPKDKWQTVFKPGYSTKTRGWGLGLSLAKRIVEEYHGGKIFVKKSSPSDGTTFSIRLPI
jgi:signal transduction histidine kinase